MLNKMETSHYNKRPVLVSICLLLGVIHSNTAQLEKTINEMIKAEVSKQLQEIQKAFIKREEFTRVQQDVKRVNEDLDNSIQGIVTPYYHKGRTSSYPGGAKFFANIVCFLIGA